MGGSDLDGILSGILDKGKGDTGYNDPVPDIDDDETESPGQLQSSPLDHITAEKRNKMVDEMDLAPGIKVAPVYMPPGAYPGDRTKMGKAYEKHAAEIEAERKATEPAVKPIEFKVVKQSEKQDYRRAAVGQTVTIKTAEDEEPRRELVGGSSLPWALEHTVQRMRVGDIMDVVGRGEHAFAEEEEVKADAERRWRLELLDIAGEATPDKFAVPTGERIDRANMLRLEGNKMFKDSRLHRALYYYELGSTFMDILEPEDLGAGVGRKEVIDKVAKEKNQRIWACQQPLLLNWALILMRLGRWQEAERKCTEVLMDIEKECVKALYRRGQCNIHLGDHEQARSDLRRAAELDTSIAGEVAKQMRRVDEMQRIADGEDRGFAKKLVGGFFQKGDERSAQPPPAKAQPAEDPSAKMFEILQKHQVSADKQDTDEDAYCRQREQIYNQFLSGTSPPEAVGALVARGEGRS